MNACHLLSLRTVALLVSLGALNVSQVQCSSSKEERASVTGGSAGSSSGGSDNGGSDDGGSEGGEAGAGGEFPDDACSQAEAVLNECSLDTSDAECDPDWEQDVCIAECFAEATCDGLEAIWADGDFDAADEVDPDLVSCYDECDELMECDDGQTIPRSWICDSAADCEDESDEVGCDWECDDGERSIPEAWV